MTHFISECTVCVYSLYQANNIAGQNNYNLFCELFSGVHRPVLSSDVYIATADGAAVTRTVCMLATVPKLLEPMIARV